MERAWYFAFLMHVVPRPVQSCSSCWCIQLAWVVFQCFWGIISFLITGYEMLSSAVVRCLHTMC